MVNVDDPPAVTAVGLNDADAPEGRPLADRETDSALPDTTDVLTVVVTGEPAVTDPDVGLAAMGKTFATGVGQPGSLYNARRVFQLKLPLAGMYSSVYQKVQPSTGSTAMLV